MRATARILAIVAITLAAPLHAHAVPASEKGVRELVERIETDLDAWDVQGARAALGELEQLFGKDSEAQGLLLLEGKVAFYEGNYARAVELFKKADTDGHQSPYGKLAEDALAETKNDAVEKSEHFDLYYPPGKDAVLAPYALETLEHAYQALHEDFGFVPPGRIRVEILPDDEALSRLSTLTIDQIRTTGTIAICKFNRLMVISPRALLHGYDWRDTLNHEFVHFVVSMKSRNTVPIWLHEGLAKFEETRWRGEGGKAMTPASEALLGLAVKKDKLITFEQMHPSMALLPSQEDAATAFAEVFHAIEFLRQKGGTKLWNAIIDNLKGGAEYQDAVASAYGAPFTKFVSDWKAYLKTRKYPQDLIPLENEKLKFKNAAQKKQDAVEATELADFQDVKDPEARKLAHLGGLLLARKRTGAALEEFGKAYAKSGDGSVQLATKYGEALLISDQYEQARKVLLAAASLHPGYELTELYLGTALLKLGDAPGARDHFYRGIDVDPFDPRLHQGLLSAFTQLKDETRAGHAKKALEILEARPEAAQPGPQARTGSILLATHPFASVSIDGKPWGRTTPTELTLQPGKHHLVLTNEERGLSKELDVEVKPGESRELRVELADNPPATR